MLNSQLLQNLLDSPVQQTALCFIYYLLDILELDILEYLLDIHNVKKTFLGMLAWNITQFLDKLQIFLHSFNIHKLLQAC